MVYVRYLYYRSRHRTVEAFGGLAVQPFLYAVVLYGSVKSCSISVSVSLTVHKLTNLINYSSF